MYTSFDVLSLVEWLLCNVPTVQMYDATIQLAFVCLGYLSS